VDEIRISVTGKVETTDLTGLLRGHRETVAPEVYMRETAAIRVTTAIATLAGEAAAGCEDNLLIAHALAEAVADSVAYVPGATDAKTTAAEALERGEGVCQDHAHLMIAAAHVLGLPARYVSGYLAPDDDGNVNEAAHAWAEVHVGSLGWVGFDPANRCCPDARYIRLGSGLDAQGAAPIRGIALGMAVESLDVTVAVQSQHQ
jgi:transglutaminase-like putative cysteine protease